ncbi:MAG: aminotransferase class V-fold PLP-dependent enzyme [Oscillibacter sp.]|jgi:cysteine desulfurase family protein|nr:aminotransferase class V-fold PLP-dependent enzyme [Oscillibacter sp.]
MIYLDSAATSFQKPDSVRAAVVRAFAEMSSPGRGGYPAAMRAADMVLECRTELQELFRVQTPEQVVFTMNATHALNIAVKSLVPPEGHAVISGYEHNAVTRPLHALNASVTVARAPLFDPEKTVAAFREAIVPGTDAVICNHVSNVFGYAQPVEEIAALCRERQVPLIIDASQSAGILLLDCRVLGAAFVAMPGHKGLCGPQGTGVLICGESAPLRPLLEGGTGSRSAEQEMPDFLPDRLEAGTQNVPGIAGLLAGVRFVRARGLARICTHERYLAASAAAGLRSVPGVQVFAGEGLFAQTGVLSFRSEKIDPDTLGNRLSQRGIAVRTGLHCAPLAHKTAGTFETGTVRASFSFFNTEAEVFRLVEAVEEILREKS